MRFSYTHIYMYTRIYIDISHAESQGYLALLVHPSHINIDSMYIHIYMRFSYTHIYMYTHIYIDMSHAES